jgi:hypothetical protein
MRAAVRPARPEPMIITLSLFSLGILGASEVVVCDFMEEERDEEVFDCQVFLYLIRALDDFYT